ncbi:MAG: response regulator, partial [Cyclobacteriaceae bacterium]
MAENEKKFNTVMLVDDNEIDNLINQKMIEAADITNHIFTHTGAKSAM